jgi:4'-phosphopantetheinyl transferase
MSLNTLWATPPEQLTLPADEVHVWRASLARTSRQELQTLQSLLAPDEVERAGRFHFERDRASFILARGMLRSILAAYLQQNPAQLRFSFSEYGKPALIVNDDNSGELRFNVSHSHELALYAVTRNREVGIDVEYMRADFASEEIAERFFSSGEVVALRALPQDRRTEGFFNCWTLKEAYIKARGEGLSFPLDRFHVSLSQGEQQAILNVHEAPIETARWSLQALMPEDGYAAAIAVEGHEWNLKCWQALPIAD